MIVWSPVLYLSLDVLVFITLYQNWTEGNISIGRSHCNDWTWSLLSRLQGSCWPSIINFVTNNITSTTTNMYHHKNTTNRDNNNITRSRTTATIDEQNFSIFRKSNGCIWPMVFSLGREPLLPTIPPLQCLASTSRWYSSTVLIKNVQSSSSIFSAPPWNGQRNSNCWQFCVHDPSQVIKKLVCQMIFKICIASKSTLSKYKNTRKTNSKSN